jgi:pyruvate dehydrogenase E1 component
MVEDPEDGFYYITVMNENIEMPAMPGDCREGILRGLYRFSSAADAIKSATAVAKEAGTPAPRKLAAKAPQVRLLASGAIVGEARQAQTLLREVFGVAAEVWSVTSWKELRQDAMECERWNRLHPEETARIPFLTQQLQSSKAPVVAATDYLRALPDSVARWVPAPMAVLGTEGYGRSEGRAALRDFFEVDSRHIALAALTELARQGSFPATELAAARDRLGLKADKPNPLSA